MAIYATHADDENLTMAQYYLDTFFAISRVDIANTLRHLSNMADLGSQPRLGLPDGIIELIRHGRFENVLILDIFILVNSLIQNPDDPEKLELFERKLEASKSNIAAGHLKNFHAFHRNFLVMLYQKYGSEIFAHKLFELMEQHLQEGLVFIDGKLPYNFLLLATVCGLKVRAFERVKKMIDDFPPEKLCGTRFLSEVCNVNLARYYHGIKSFDEALKLLEYRNFENVNIGIMADVIQIKVYFETGNDLLEFKMQSMGQRVRRSDISDQTKTYYHNFLKKLDKVIKYGWEKNSKMKGKLKAEIQKMGALYEKDWLLEQLTN
jgi:hypothetical protein